MCPVSHWLILVMLPVLFAICSHHVAIVSCNVLMLDLLSVSLVCPCQFKSVASQVCSSQVKSLIMFVFWITSVNKLHMGSSLHSPPVD